MFRRIWQQAVLQPNKLKSDCPTVRFGSQEVAKIVKQMMMLKCLGKYNEIGVKTVTNLFIQM